MSTEDPPDMTTEAPSEMAWSVTSPRLTYRPLHENDWPFYRAVSQDRSVMRYISDPRSVQEIRSHSFDVRLPAWYPGCKHWLCLVIEEKTSGLPRVSAGLLIAERALQSLVLFWPPTRRAKVMAASRCTPLSRSALSSRITAS